MATKVTVLSGGTDKASDGNVIDPRASVHPSARVGLGCSIGPFAVIGQDVILGPQCVIHSHAVLHGPTALGPKNRVHSFACIGGPPQDLRYRGEKTTLVIGTRNEFREHVTVNRGTTHGGGVTTIGDNNLLMAYSHVAHDCHLGDHIVMANHATIAGHTHVQDHVVFGGMVGVGQFLRIGESAMLAAGSMIEQEIPPFCTVAGDRARLRAVNRIGLERRNIGPRAKKQIKAIFKALKERGTPLARIITELGDLEALTPEAQRMLVFLGQVTHGLAR
ncbi:MAG: acyl-ACP--UDP-N-acetylglucosamine O-acyltransferase [Proteobacteria bacterium]|nr:acyl-ACP--UDP-N-acetylglucosamine O-acyltransferase [Pseudomonadota bacterium]